MAQGPSLGARAAIDELPDIATCLHSPVVLTLKVEDHANVALLATPARLMLCIVNSHNSRCFIGIILGGNARAACLPHLEC